ncbi:MAG: GDSL family lipase, partial [Deltaproteobacteria bacterium]|nr:GDSL family lipase [Deltaproteobacteria bacterium]
AKLVVGSILPLNSLRLGVLGPGNALVRKANSALATAAEAFRIEFLDHYWLMAGPDGELRQDLTDDGIHLLPRAYGIWLQALKDCPAFGA